MEISYRRTPKKTPANLWILGWHQQITDTSPPDTTSSISKHPRLLECVMQATQHLHSSAMVTLLAVLVSTWFPRNVSSLAVPLQFSFPRVGQDDIILTVFEEDQDTESKIEEHQLGLKSWRGGELLAAFLCETLSESIKGATVLELGCGVGLPGIMAAKLGAKRVVLTDMTQQLIETAQLGAEASGVQDTCTFMRLDWKDVVHNKISITKWKQRLIQEDDEQSEFDYILASDCVYSVFTARLLAQTVAAVMDPTRTEFLALTGSRSDRSGVDMLQKELQKAMPNAHIRVAIYDSAEICSANGQELPLSNGRDLYGNLIWRVTCMPKGINATDFR